MVGIAYVLKTIFEAIASPISSGQDPPQHIPRAEAVPRNVGLLEGKVVIPGGMITPPVVLGPLTPASPPHVRVGVHLPEILAPTSALFAVVAAL